VSILELLYILRTKSSPYAGNTTTLQILPRNWICTFILRAPTYTSEPTFARAAQRQ
jgi:hypothetical protein